MKPTPKSNSFRFAIADGVPRSECWSFFTNGNDVYLTGSAYKRVLKISLHERGVCQIAMLKEFFVEHVEGRSQAPQFRDILRWKRIPTPLIQGQVAATILFASCEFWPEKDPIPASKPFKSLPPPPSTHCLNVDVVYSRVNPQHISKVGEWTDDLLFSLQLPNGEFVCLMQRIDQLPEDFFDFGPIGRRRFLTLDVEEADMKDIRGISVFDCALLNEGCGHVQSLHNMRLMTVDAARGMPNQKDG